MIWRALWKLLRWPVPRLLAVCIAVDGDGVWTQMKAVGFTFRGARNIYATIELMQRYEPMFREYEAWARGKL